MVDEIDIEKVNLNFENFEEFLQKKYPLWREVNVDDIQITVKHMKELVLEWLNTHNGHV